MIAVSALCAASIIGGAVALAATQPHPTGLLPLASGNLPAAKAAAIRSMEAAQRKAALHPMRKNSDYAPPPDPQPARTSGIVQTRQSPLPSSEFGAWNAWRGPGTVAGQWLVVYAGESVQGSNKIPALLIYSEPANPNARNQYFTEVGLYTDNAATGPLSVTAARNHVLTLSAGAGSTKITFTLSTHSFS